MLEEGPDGQYVDMIVELEMELEVHAMNLDGFQSIPHSLVDFRRLKVVRLPASHRCAVRALAERVQLEDGRVEAVEDVLVDARQRVGVVFVLDDQPVELKRPAVAAAER